MEAASYYQQATTLFRALSLPLLTYLALDICRQAELNSLGYGAIVIAGVLVQITIAITTHRLVLLGKQPENLWRVFSFSRRELSFLAHLIGLVLILLPIALLALIPALGNYLALTTACWLTGRLSLVFPSIALEEPISFADSWQLTQRHQIAMFMLIGVLSLLLAFSVYLVDLVSQSAWLGSIVSLLLLVFEILLLSLTYRYIRQQERNCVNAANSLQAT